MMPLLEDPEFWVVLAVLIFVIGVWKPARRAILGGLDARAARIRDELEGAQRLREEAERALAAYQRQQQQAAAEAAAILAHARGGKGYRRNPRCYRGCRDFSCPPGYRRRTRREARRRIDRRCDHGTAAAIAALAAQRPEE